MAYPPPPPPQQPPYSAPPKKGGPGCWLWLLGGCVVLVVGCLVVAGGGFVLYRSGLITVNSMLNLVGLGPADVDVDNFRDSTIYVQVRQVQAASSSTVAAGFFQLDSFDLHTYHAQPPGRYRLDFGSALDAADLGTCTLTLKSGDHYQFVTLPDKIVINNVNRPANTGPDFIVSSSALCR